MPTESLIVIPTIHTMEDVRQVLAQSLNQLQRQILAQLPPTNMEGKRLENLASPYSSDDAVTLGYLNSALSHQQAQLAALANRKRQSSASVSASGTHTARLATPAAGYPSGLFFETDRGNVGYRSNGTVWNYVSGMYADVLASQPSDLTTSDAGFLFFSTDTIQQFRWSGTAWVALVTVQDNAVQYTMGSGPVTLTTGLQDLTGLSLTLARSGTYLIVGTFMFDTGGSVNDVGFYYSGQVNANGVGLPGATQYAPSAASGGAGVSGHWTYSATAGQVVKLQASKNGGTGVGYVRCGYSSITALWVAP